MDICLICDESMHEKPADGQIDHSKKYKHKEHVIQNAIGGRLKSSRILCESCGNILNSEIDVDFQKLFLLVTARINDLGKDRNAKADTRLQGVHIGSKKEIKYVNKIPVPLKPTFHINDAEEKVVIYCQKKMVHHFRKSVIKNLESAGKQHYKIEEVHEFRKNDQVWLSFSKDVENFNDKWKMGFIKIATEFAYMHGVKKEQLVKTLDKDKKKLIFSDNLYPYIPVTAIDYFLEYNKNIIERNYPSHTLHLYTQAYNADEKQLICYVELFSTFQYYVLLTDKYVGPDIKESYSQRLVTEEKQDLDIKGFSPKDLMAEAAHFGIDIKKYYGVPMEEMYSHFENEYAKLQPVYELDLKSELDASLKLVSAAIMQSLITVPMIHTGGAPSELIEFLGEFPKKYKIQLVDEMTNFYDHNNQIIIERFRKLYPEISKDGNVDFISMAAKCLEIAEKDIQKIKDYGHEKFDFLSYFLNVQQNLGNA